ncbi:hypothetical protein [Burkholderia sp. Ac-20379]|uniref:hypothetical protein n=1 Tax=Burkholderia sp. Ac-20379 TaxID=2703900 RepID=UPI0019808588|nr:hypothetical protein [Burkholderia sp. Ac-20379]MBN3723059.1 hypothetical protein [Burkholderia sp. Ac-20379]
MNRLVVVAGARYEFARQLMGQRHDGIIFIRLRNERIRKRVHEISDMACADVFDCIEVLRQAAT